MSKVETTGGIGTAFGIVFGGTIAIIGAAVLRQDLTIGLIYGPPWGIITGGLSGLAVDKDLIDEDMFPLVGSIWGGISGSIISLLIAWSDGYSYMDLVIYGFIVGLVGGLFLSYITMEYMKRETL